jgi:hypothetical protein
LAANLTGRISLFSSSVRFACCSVADIERSAKHSPLEKQRALRTAFLVTSIRRNQNIKKERSMGNLSDRWRKEARIHSLGAPTSTLTQEPFLGGYRSSV